MNIMYVCILLTFCFCSFKNGLPKHVAMVTLSHFPLQNVMVHLGDQWHTLILAEQSVLVDIFHSPQALFPFESKPYHKAMKTFCKRFVRLEHSVAMWWFVQLAQLLLCLPCAIAIATVSWWFTIDSRWSIRWYTGYVVVSTV